MTERSLLDAAYAAFNARDIDAALATMHGDVDWPNGIEGGRVHGHEAVREYWTRQWEEIDPHVEPIGFEPAGPGAIAVDVHQVIRDRDGKSIVDTIVVHLYRIDDGLIRSMEIHPYRAAGSVESVPGELPSTDGGENRG